MTVLCHRITQSRDHALSEHQTLKEVAADLDAMSVTHPGFKDKLEFLMTVSHSGIQAQQIILQGLAKAGSVYLPWLS